MQSLLQEEDSVIRCDYRWLYYNIIIFERKKSSQNSDLHSAETIRAAHKRVIK